MGRKSERKFFCLAADFYLGLGLDFDHAVQLQLSKVSVLQVLGLFLFSSDSCGTPDRTLGLD